MTTQVQGRAGLGEGLVAILYVYACEAWPAFRRVSRRAMYSFLARLAPRRDWTFMNYGYAPLDPTEPVPALHPSDEPNRYCIQLYHHVVGAVNLSGRKVLEVGSGRGGGSAYLLRAMAPAEMVGLDYSEPAVALCQRIHTGAGLRFVHGDAEQLPFDDSSYDAVVNIESSHCYGSMQGFLMEVARVLRPGGHLLFADFRRPEDLDALLAAFDAAGLQRLRQTDITPNILSALALDNARKLAQIRASAPRWLTRMLGEFAGIPGSRIHEHFTYGSTVYLSCVLRKAAV